MIETPYIKYKAISLEALISGEFVEYFEVLFAINK